MGARMTADLTGASLIGATLAGASLGADMKNQSMGLMRVVFKSAKLDGINARGADFSRGGDRYIHGAGFHVPGQLVEPCEGAKKHSVHRAFE